MSPPSTPFEKFVDMAESTGDGWIYAGDVPPCDVFLDDVKLKYVKCANRKEAKAVIAVLDEHGLPSHGDESFIDEIVSGSKLEFRSA